jgi:hypothetical protein
MPQTGTTSAAPPKDVTDTPPSHVFDLRGWKLQIPGPKEIKELDGYTSRFFYLNREREMCFALDASEKGTTPNAKYVRSELRHLPNWPANESHSLSAEVRAESRLDPDKVTVLQIHGITEDRKDAPPLLRIALQKGDLVAVVQTGSERGQNTPTTLKKGLRDGWANVEIVVEQKRLIIHLDGRRALERDLAFWPYPNYFKAGCYPQATKGDALVAFRRLKVR